MTDFSIRGFCETCGKKHWFIRKRDIPVPTAGMARSKKLMCNACYGKIKTVLTKN